MSPTPIIERQRSLSRGGEIRTGGEKPEKGVGKKLDTFRLTSQHKDIIDNCAGLYGGTPEPWQSPTGDAWQLYTTTSALPCLVIAGYSVRQLYERWEGVTKCTRRCDGEEEQISGSPCICNANGKDECDIVTRLMVVLHETGTSLGWQLRSIGENAARELSGAMMVADELARGRHFVPATLRLTQRRGVVNGQTVRYVVPVLDFNLQAEARAIEPAATYKALPPANGVGVTEALAAVNEEKKPRGRQSAPIGPAPDDLLHDAPPLPVGEQPSVPALAKDDGKVTAAQKKKLNVLVGQLRDAGHITTEQLWAAMARQRSIDADTMLELLAGRDEQGVCHWTPLRDSLTVDEASGLIKRLGKLAANVEAVA